MPHNQVIAFCPDLVAKARKKWAFFCFFGKRRGIYELRLTIYYCGERGRRAGGPWNLQFASYHLLLGRRRRPLPWITDY